MFRQLHVDRLEGDHNDKTFRSCVGSIQEKILVIVSLEHACIVMFSQII